MAVDNHLPVKTSSPALACSSSSSSSSGFSFDRQRPSLIQVATNNSSTFIQFPNSRQSALRVPIGRPTTANSVSSTRPSLLTVDTQSLSSKSKLSTDAPILSTKVTPDHRRAHSHQRANPILNNPLLNHRKEQPKPIATITSSEFSRTSRLCLSSKPMQTGEHHEQSPVIRASTAPVLPHRQTTNDVHKSPNICLSNENENDDQEQQHYIDKNKYDYITRWLNEVRAATRCSEPIIPKSKRTKRRMAQQ